MPTLHPLDDDLHDDDLPVGTILSRRRALALFASAPVGFWLAGCSGTEPGGTDAGTCVVRPALTEGPYYVDEGLDRSDIRPDTGTGTLAAGLPLALTVNVGRVSGAACQTLAGAVVDVWHADARGVYSEFGTGAGQDFLRGFQTTGADGAARFTTVYPGWYSGRATHIHFKVRSGAYEFTSQLFFDDAFTDAVYANAPYNSRGTRTTRNASDGIYRQGDTGLVLGVTGSASGGYAATFNLALDLD